MGKNKDFTMFIKSENVLVLFLPVLFISRLKAFGKKRENKTR